MNEQLEEFSEEQLQELLAEIRDDDDYLQEIESEAEEQIAIEEEQSDNLYLQELPENAEIEAFYGDNAWHIASATALSNTGEIISRAVKASVEARAKKVETIKRDRIQIQRLAFAQTDLKLSDAISRNELKELIALLTEEHVRIMQKCKAMINLRMTKLLRPFIPRVLKNCKLQYPNSIVHSPGFLYVASNEYGQGQSFWITPDIPYYFEQGTECTKLKEYKPEVLFSVDKMISSYYNHQAKLRRKELNYASLLISRKIATYYDLLKLNPFWFDKLYQHKFPNER